jgi:hypothetical protein
MIRRNRLLELLVAGIVLLAPTRAASQEVKCEPLSDEEALKFITERGQLLVRGSGIECKAGGTLILIRYRIIDYTARYDCEVHAQGDKPYCWRLS